MSFPPGPTGTMQGSMQMPLSWDVVSVGVTLGTKVLVVGGTLDKRALDGGDELEAMEVVAAAADTDIVAGVDEVPDIDEVPDVDEVPDIEAETPQPAVAPVAPEIGIQPVKAEVSSS